MGIGSVKGLELMNFTNRVFRSPQLLLPTSGGEHIERSLRAAEKEISLRSAGRIVIAHDNSAFTLEVPCTQTDAIH